MKERILVDLFSGAGGLSCGLKHAGFIPTLSNEINPVYANTYKKNHQESDVIVGDIREVTELVIKQKLHVHEDHIDLIAGGPPCQGFSINAPIRSLDDKRNHLFKDFLRVVSILRPKAVLIENVPGIVSLGQGTVVQQIYKELEGMGYKVDHKVLFAGHYGIPQLRYRTIFIAILNYKGIIKFPEPTHNASGVTNFTGSKELCLKFDPLFTNGLKDKVTVREAISDLPPINAGEIHEQLPYYLNAQSEYQELLRMDSNSIYNHYCSKLGVINLERLKYIPQGGSWRDIPFSILPEGLKRARRSDHTKRYGRLHPDGLCSTILTKCDPHWGSFFHPEQDRVISVREAARIQSFPDNYIFYGSLTEQYEQVGNAVPPLLAEAIGKEIIKMIEDIHE